MDVETTSCAYWEATVKYFFFRKLLFEKVAYYSVVKMRNSGGKAKEEKLNRKMSV